MSRKCGQARAVRASGSREGSTAVLAGVAGLSPQRRGRLRRRKWCEKRYGTAGRARLGGTAGGGLRAGGQAGIPVRRRAVGAPSCPRLHAAEAAHPGRRLPALPGTATGWPPGPGRAGRRHGVPGGRSDQPQQSAVHAVRRTDGGDRGAGDRRHNDADQGRHGRRLQPRRSRPGKPRPGQSGWVTLSYGDGCPALTSGGKAGYRTLFIVLDGGRVRVEFPAAALNLICGLEASKFGVPQPPPPGELGKGLGQAFVRGQWRAIGPSASFYSLENVVANLPVERYAGYLEPPSMPEFTQEGRLREGTRNKIVYKVSKL